MNHRVLDRTLKFTHVPWPEVGLQRMHDIRRNTQNVLVQFPIEQLVKMFRQDRDIFGTIMSTSGRLVLINSMRSRAVAAEMTDNCGDAFVDLKIRFVVDHQQCAHEAIISSMLWPL